MEASRSYTHSGPLERLGVKLILFSSSINLHKENSEGSISYYHNNHRTLVCNAWLKELQQKNKNGRNLMS